MCSDKQAWKVYFQIYSDEVNPITELCEATKEQEVLRYYLERLGWDSLMNNNQLQDKIKNKLSSEQASSIIELLATGKFKEVEKII